MFHKKYTIERWDGESYHNVDLVNFIKDFRAWNFFRKFGTESDFGLREVSSWNTPANGYITVKGSYSTVYKTIVKHEYLVKNSKGIILDPWMVLANYHRDIDEISFMRPDYGCNTWYSTSRSRKRWRQSYRRSNRKVHQIMKAKYNVAEDGEPPIRNKCKLYINCWDDDYHRNKADRSWKYQSKRNKQYKGA